MTDWTAIEAELEGMLAASGYELVNLEVHSGRGARLTISVDRLAEAGAITLDECAELSRRIGAWLDVVDPFRGRYRLQVSSPGVDRPLRRLADCERFVGRLARIRYRHAEGPRAVTGRLEEVGGGAVVMEVKGERLEVEWPEVIEANLVYDWDA